LVVAGLWLRRLREHDIDLDFLAALGCDFAWADAAAAVIPNIAMTAGPIAACRPTERISA